jgi:PAS domain S-box-containing protein
VILQVFLNGNPERLTEPPDKPPLTGKSMIVLSLLIIAGFLGNYFTLPLFFGADFLFGSVAVLLVLYLYGLQWGMLAAVVAHSYTYVLWGHPYGFINFISEALFIGIFLKRGRRNLLALDGLFWLIVGMPLVWVEHGMIMQMGTVSSAFIMLKQAINGIFNVLIVSLIICYAPLDKISRSPQFSPRTTLRESLFNLMVVIILFPALLFTRLEITREKQRLEAGVMVELQSLSANMQFNLRSWYQLHFKAVQELAALAGQSPMTPSAQLQRDAEILNRSFPDFRTMHVENADGRTIAFHPPLNEKGEPTLGLDFSGRPWFRQIKVEQQPLVSDIFVGHMAVFSPIVNLCAPVIRENHWLGCATGTLDLKRVQDMLRPYRSDKMISLTLTDLQDRIIASTELDRLPLQSWNRRKTGVSQPLPKNARIYLWHTDDKYTPSMSRWKDSFFVQETSLGPDLPWKLTAEAPVAPLQDVLYVLYVKNLAIMACLTALALLLSRLFSGSLTRPLAKFALVTSNLPAKLLDARNIDWPASSTWEVGSLINNFKSMAKALEANFHQLHAQSNELRQANRELAQEVQDRRQAEDALRQSEDRLKKIVDSLDVGVMIVDAETHRILSINPKALSLFGDLEDRVLGAVCHQYICPAEKEKCPITDLGGAVNASERILLTAQGQRLPIIKSVVQTKIANQDCLVESFIDITELKRTEEALRDSEDRYRSLVANATDMIFIAQDGICKFPNPATAAITGYSEQELATLPFANILHPEDSETVTEKHAKRLRGEEVPNTYSFRILSKEGETLWVQLNAVLITWEGKPGVLCSLRDITPQKRLEAQYLHAQKMEAIGTLAGGVAHDFNNLLQVVSGYAELLLAEKKTEDPAYQPLTEIHQAAHRGAELTRQLLTFSRKVQSKQKPLNLNQEIVDVEKLLQRTIPKMIQVELRLTGDLWTVSADPVQIGQLIMNLAVNARDAMPEGGSLVISTQNVTLDGEFCRGHVGSRPGRHVLLSVSDTGQGMTKEVLARLFEPFFTTKGMGKGTGLGLAMVYGIVKGHDGYIECESEPGKGTLFRTYLPAVEQLVEEETAEVKELPRGGTETILLADDEASLRDLAKRVLSRFGYTVLTAPDGEGALDLYRAKKERIHLVILDLIMPGMGGLRCLEEILRINPDAKAVIATGYHQEDSCMAAHGGQARGFIRKPYDINELVLEVRRALDH